ncbi:SP_1767 family glycosyltransferase [Neobacillus sp. PS3-34]|uniref:SP_1767 family glycosyltransferase n=1 Tax=Neobacillus sp. PS3-34 TaxID=3070678 RepID=UPI0027E0E788|nr:SP_1767 family glycosyltransferase [Neobacillus sp. PS3-34]WML47817.1 SP_1767 family glycosyltransferase [Neobacillus sp. PS3-34]
MKNLALKVYYKLMNVKDSFTVLNNKLVKFIIKPPLVRKTDETLDKIINDKCSVSRYGDADFGIMCKRSLIYQTFDNNLRLRLKEIIKSDNENHIVCIPDVFGNLGRFTDNSRLYWINYLSLNRHKIYRMLDMKKQYYDAMVTRLYIDYKDKSNAGERFLLFKKLWTNRDIVIVEGEQSRLGIGNNLFDTARSIRRILCPSTNAFAKYNEILAEVKKYDKSSLILIALGPTATVLAFDLSNIGYQAIDIGNIDIEYEWFLQKAVEKLPIKNKYIGEIPNGTEVEGIVDMRYDNEIIGRIV